MDVKMSKWFVYYQIRKKCFKILLTLRVNNKLWIITIHVNVSSDLVWFWSDNLWNNGFEKVNMNLFHGLKKSKQIKKQAFPSLFQYPSL